MRRILYYIVYVVAVFGMAWMLAGCAHAPPQPFPEIAQQRQFGTPVASRVTDTPAMRLKLLAGYGPSPGTYARRWRYDNPESVIVESDPRGRRNVRSYSVTSTYDSLTVSNGFVNDNYSRRRWGWTRESEQRDNSR